MGQFFVGEKLVWVHTDENTGQKLQEFVVVKGMSNGRRTQATGKPYYLVQVLRTGEPAQCWHDELFRWDQT